MPAGPGTYGGGTLTGAARSQQGIPEPSATPNVRDLTRGLRSGQLGADQVIQLLMMLFGQGPGAAQQAQAQPGGGQLPPQVMQQLAAQGGGSPGGGRPVPAQAGGPGPGAGGPIEQALRGG